MEEKPKLGQKLTSLFSGALDILHYQIVTKAIIAVWLFLLGRIFQALLKSSGRVAVTSGDYQFLVTTWQGWLILLLGLVSLFVYVAFDLNAKILISRNLLTGQKAYLWNSVDEGFRSIKRYLSISGIGIVLYIAFLSPILGISLSISLTENLYIPTFISSFIESSVLYSALAGIAMIVFLSIGIGNLFILHGIVLDKLSAAEAGRQSRQLMKDNWKDYLKQNVMLILAIAVSLAIIAAICLVLPLKIIYLLPMADSVRRFLTVFFVIAGVIVSVLADLFAMPVYLMKMTQLYYRYKDGEELGYQETKRELGKRYKVALVLAIILVLAIDCAAYVCFDRLFPAETKVKIVAHRGGGNEGAENTVSGLEAASRLGAYGSEIDIQRTKDGGYVVNHDGTFKRVAGDNRKPEEMTLKEIRKLSVDGEPVPTFEDMMSASKGRMVLFIELKGSTADRKMADDAVALIRKYQMEDECVLISLKYGLIDYIETTYPDIQTGFLLFAAIGETAELNCDYIGLEEESATTDTIRSIHKEGKKVLVWTANEKGSQKQFLCSNADGIITDKVAQAMKLISALEKRTDLERMIDRIKAVI